MKKLFILLTVAVAMVSCQQGNSYKISGTVADPAYEGTTVYLQDMKGREMISLDSALITNGAFNFEGVADTVKVRYISFDRKVKPGQMSRGLAVLEPGKIKITYDSLISVTGSKLNDAYDIFKKDQDEVSKELRVINEKFQNAEKDSTLTPEIEEELRTQYESIYKRIQDKTIEFIKLNIGNELGKYLLLTSVNAFEPEVQKELIALTDDDFKSKEEIQKLLRRIENAEKVAIGKKFIDFTMKDTKGNDVSLSDYAGKGNVVLVDFWAAWCGPCRQEMPNVVEAYKQFKKKGFEVVGVSLDRNTEEWEKGIKDLNMTWPQMSDLKFWETPVVELYAFRGIPHTVLLDKDGTIIAKDLRGKALHDKLNELLGS